VILVCKKKGTDELDILSAADAQYSRRIFFDIIPKALPSESIRIEV